MKPAGGAGSAATVLVTGGTGLLGRYLVPVLEGRGHTVRVMSRHARPPDLSPGLEWATADLATGHGVSRALSGVDSVVHAASSAGRAREVDVRGLRDHLLPAARTAGVRHLVYPSIVGIDAIPFGYYRAKREAERLLDASGVPHTIARATQFHGFVHRLIAAVGRLPVMGVPAGATIQPVYASEVARYLVELLEEDPRGRAPDFAGPEVLSLARMVSSWAEAVGRRRWVVPVPLPGAFFGALRHGKATNPSRAVGRLTWEQWLSQHVEGRQARGSPEG